MRGVSNETRGVLYALLPVLVFAAAPSRALEPAGPLEISARVATVEPTSRSDRRTPAGIAEIEVGVVAHDTLSELTIRVLDAARNPVEAGVTIDGPVLILRVPLTGMAVHERIVEATAISASGPVRDEIALRIPLGVSGFAPEEDGEIAAFPLEVRP